MQGAGKEGIDVAPCNHPFIIMLYSLVPAPMTLKG